MRGGKKSAMCGSWFYPCVWAGDDEFDGGYEGMVVSEGGRTFLCGGQRGPGVEFKVGGDATVEGFDVLRRVGQGCEDGR